MRKNFFFTIVFSVAAGLVISGCAVNLRTERKSVTDFNKEELKAIQEDRVLAITQAGTPYSQPLRCLGRIFQERTLTSSARKMYDAVAGNKVTIVSSEEYAASFVRNQEKAKKIDEKIIGINRDVQVYEKSLGLINEKFSLAITLPKTKDNMALRARISNTRDEIKNRIDSWKKEVSDLSSEKIRILSENLQQVLTKKMFEDQMVSAAFWNYPFSVAPIFDKTGKVFSPSSTAISDMVLQALSVAGISVIETPLGYSFSETRTNLSAIDAKNMSFYLSGNSLPVGVAFKSMFHVSGGIISYDDSTEAPQKSLAADVDIARFNKSVNSVKIVVNLRLIDSRTGLVYKKLGERRLNVGAREWSVQKNEEGASIVLTTELIKVKGSANIFKVNNSGSPYGVDYQVSVADPIQYAVMEVIEKGVFSLMEDYVSDSPTGCIKEFGNVKS